MKTTLQQFFKSKKNKIIASSILAFTILVGAGFYLNSQEEQQKQEQARIEKEKAEEQAKKQQEEKEKIELAKAEEKKKAEELEKEKLKAEEEKAKVEQQKSEVDKREKDNFVENKSNSSKKETQKNSNSTSKKTDNSTKNKKKDNNNSNQENTFEVEGDGYPTVLGNSGRFFSSKSEADNWAFAQLENDDSNWTKSGYRRFSTSQCKRNGQIGWTVNFRK